MAYSRTVWQDKIKDETGQVIQEGTPLSAQNLNNIEAGIEENTEQLLSLIQTQKEEPTNEKNLLWLEII